MSVVAEIVEKIEKLTLLEAVELKKSLEEKFGVTAAAPIMMGGMMSAAGAAAPAAAVEEKTEFNVELKSTGAQKINVIKALREINPNLTLMDAKGMTEVVPAEVLKDAKAEDAKAASDKLVAAGAKVELK